MQSESLPEQHESSLSDRREFPRTSFQTAVTVLCVTEDDDGHQSVATFRAWSQDISPAGARVFTREPLDCGRLYLKFLLPEIGNRFIEAQIVNQGEEVQTTISGNVRRLPAYGVRFLRVVDDAEIEQLQQQLELQQPEQQPSDQTDD